MTRRRITGLVALAVVVGFLFGVGVYAVAVGTDHPGPPQVFVATGDAATASANSRASTAFGAKQAAVHLAAKRTAPIVPFIRTLKLGTTDGAEKGAVTQLQRALIRAKVKPRPIASGSFGVGTQHALEAFQKAKKVKPVTGVYGPKSHHQLQPYYDLAGRRALQAVQHTRAQLAKYARITHGTSYAWVHRTSMAYSQSFTRQFLPLLPGFPRATDCSGYVTWVFKVSGLPDPNGFGYGIVGYTGTLAQHGTRVSANAAFHVGDLVFYGGGYPYGHVAIVVDAFKRTVSSHGSPGIKVVPFNYRPVSAVRRYF